jgi:hypothetical protein
VRRAGKREGGRSRVADIRTGGGTSSRKQQQRPNLTSASTAAVAVAAFLRTISCLATFGENITICPLSQLGRAYVQAYVRGQAHRRKTLSTPEAEASRPYRGPASWPPSQRNRSSVNLSTY